MSTNLSGKAVTHRFHLPKLLYLADVPVEASYHGSALIYRLLQGYPAGQLCIVESGLSESQPERRLPGVAYHRLPMPGTRWLNTRLNRWVSAALSLHAPVEVSRLSRLVEDFRCEAVLTVTHGYSWLTAALFARQRRIPLHLIIHDDWPRAMPDIAPIRQWVGHQFGLCYRQAASRLCISPFMVEEYERRYETRGSVLYPSRSQYSIRFDGPPKRLSETSHKLTFAFAGTINSPGYIYALQLLTQSLASVNGRLLLYGPLKQDQCAKIGLTAENIEVRGMLSSNKLIQQLRSEADVLFVPMSFRSEDRANMEFGFPSKLADYTALGLPLFIYGPPYCSAVRWARENQGVAEVVDVEEGEVLKAAAHRLAADSEHRCHLARRAIEVGMRFFSREAATATFHAALAY